MEEAKKNLNYEEKYKDILDRYTKMQIEIHEYENAYHLLSNEIDMLQCEKEYLLDLLCDIEDAIMKHEALLSIKSQTIHSKRNRSSQSTESILLHSSEKLLGWGEDFLAKRIHYDLLNQDPKKRYVDETKELEEILQNWEKLTEEEKQNFNDLVHSKTSFIQSPLPDDLNEDSTLERDHLSSKGSPTLNLSISPSEEEDLSGRSNPSSLVSPVPIGSSDVSLSPSPLLNSTHPPFIQFKSMHDKKLLDKTAEILQQLDQQNHTNGVINPNDSDLEPTQSLVSKEEGSTGTSPKDEAHPFTRKPSVYERKFIRRGSIVSRDPHDAGSYNLSSGESEPIKEHEDSSSSEISKKDSNSIHLIHHSKDSESKASSLDEDSLFSSKESEDELSSIHSNLKEQKNEKRIIDFNSDIKTFKRPEMESNSTSIVSEDPKHKE